MRIVYLSYSSIPSREANAVHVMNMCQAFARNGHDVTLFARRGKNCVKDVFAHYGVDRCFEVVLSRAPRVNGLGGVMYGLSVRRTMAGRAQPDLYYARDIYGLLAVASFKRPMVYESHNPPKRFFGKRMQRFLLGHNFFRRLVVISKALRDEYKHLYPMCSDRQFHVAPDAANIVSDRASEDTPVDTPGNGRFKAGYIGQLYAGKGAGMVLAIARTLSDVDFHIVGGTDRDIAYWKREARDLKNVIFHGYLSPRDVVPFRRAMDILLAPYQAAVKAAGGKLEIARWMSPLKIFEYMAAGKPIVASDLPVLREVLTDRENALLVPAADAAAWAKTIMRLKNDPALRTRLARRALEDLEAHFTWQKRAQSVLEGVVL